MEALERRISSVGGGGNGNGDNDDAVANANNNANEVHKLLINVTCVYRSISHS